MKIICTTMVRNESKILARMLKSAAVVADAALVMDTGSTDNTIEVAKATMAELKLPVKIAAEPWQNFGYNRTKAIEAAQQYCKELGWDPEHTYLLLLDADLTLEVNPKFKDLPHCGIPETHPVIELRQITHDLDYSNTRLLRASLNIKYVRRTHEFIDYGKAERLAFNGVFIRDIGDGGCKADKFVRDERLLKLDLQDMPGDGRSMFYLANTLKNLRRFAEAEHWYKLRTKAGGWDEEIWQSWLMAGRCCIEMGKHDEAQKHFWKAFEVRPWRAEPLVELSQRYLDTGDRKRAEILSRIGMSLPYPSKDGLFIEKDAYQWKLKQNFYVASFYTDSRKEGWRICDQLHFDSKCPRQYLALQNNVHFMEPIKSEMKPIAFSAPEGYHPSNVSLLELEDRYLVCLRCVNYNIDKDGGYTVTPVPNAEANVIDTRNFLLQYDKKMQNPKTICELQPMPRTDVQATIRGCEDTRIFECRDGVFSALTTRWDMKTRHPRMYFCQWTLDGTPIKCDYLDKTPEDVCEKNWLPWLVKGEPMVLYSTSPIVSVFPLSDIKADINSKGPLGVNLRGSTAPLPWGDGWLYTIHEVVIMQGMKKRTYVYRFCFMNRNYELIKVSKPFYFRQKGIEFCAGAVLNSTGLYMGVSFDDADTHIVTVAVGTIEQLLAEGPKLEM